MPRKNIFLDEILEDTLRQTYYLNLIHSIIISKEYSSLTEKEKIEKINSTLYEWRWPWSHKPLREFK